MPQNRVYVLDILRIISALGVIVVHTISDGLKTYEVGTIPRRIINTIQGAWHRSVPVFLMLTGIFLLRKDKLDEDPISFYRSRLLKVIIPFLICVGVFILFDYAVLQNKTFNLYYVLLDFVNIGYYFHLWYILLIIGLYIIMPFFRIIIKHSPVRILYLYIFIRFAFKIINKIIVTVFGVPRAGTPGWFLGYDGLAIIGYCIRNHKFIASWLSIKQSILIYVFSAIITILATGYVSINGGKFADYFYQNNTPNVLLMAISLVVMARHLYDNIVIPEKYIYYIRQISKISFGTYMYHPIFIYIYKFIFNKLGFSTGFNMLLTIICSVISVGLFVFFIQKTSLGKKILPET